MAIVGRQPIRDRSNDLVGYELLFRPLASSTAAADPAAPALPTGDEMTDMVVAGALSIGLSRLVGDRLIFCNADRAVLSGRTPLGLPPGQTVIEIIETVRVDDDVIAGCRALLDAGYRLAADDFRWFPGAENLLELVDYVKVDLRVTPPGEVEPLMERCRPYGVTMLAEKVETVREYDAVHHMGFDLFQGYHLDLPTTVTGPAVASRRSGAIRLAAAVLDDDVDYARIEDILRTTPVLSYQLLQLAAVGRFGELSRKIKSLRQALVYIGMNRLRGFIPALLLRPAGPAEGTGLPTVLTRARLVEILAETHAPDLAGQAFTAAMISALDLLIGVPAATLPALLDLPQQLRYHAFDPESDIRRLIDCAIHYEKHTSWPAALPARTHPDATEAAARAFTWAMQAIEAVDHPARLVGTA